MKTQHKVIIGLWFVVMVVLAVAAWWCRTEAAAAAPGSLVDLMLSVATGATVGVLFLMTVVSIALGYSALKFVLEIRAADKRYAAIMYERAQAKELSTWTIVNQD